MRFTRQHAAACVLFALLFAGRLIAAPVDLLSASAQNSGQPAVGDLRVPNPAIESQNMSLEVDNYGYYTTEDDDGYYYTPEDDDGYYYTPEDDDGYFPLEDDDDYFPPEDDDDYFGPEDDDDYFDEEEKADDAEIDEDENRLLVKEILIATFSSVSAILLCCSLCRRCTSCLKTFADTARDPGTNEPQNSMPGSRVQDALESQEQDPLLAHQDSTDLPNNPSCLDSVFNMSRIEAAPQNGGDGDQLPSDPSLSTVATPHRQVPRPSGEEDLQRFPEEEDDRSESAASRLANPPIRDRCCTICFENPRNAVLIPCGHGNMCLECTKKISICPYCRVKITGRLRVFSDD